MTGTGNLRRWLLPALVALLAAAAARWRLSDRGHTSASPGAVEPGDAGLPPAFAPAAVTMARGVHLLGKIVPGNAYVVETSAGLILIDSGFHPDAGHVLQQLAELNLSASDVRMVLLTHIHADHVLGARYFRQRTGATIHAGAGDAPLLEAGSDKDAFFSKYTMSGVQLHPTEIDVALAGGETIRLGDTTMTALATPGHTPGSICYLLERDGRRMLFTGDTISTLTAELGTYITRHPPRFRGDARAYAESLRSLRELPAPDLVFPGHTEDDPPGQTPAMNARLWEELLQRGIRECLTITSRFESDGADFLADDPFEIEDGIAYLGRFDDHPIYMVFVAGAVVLFDAPAGDGLMEFIRSRLERLGRALPAQRFVLLTASDGRGTGGLAGLVAESGFVPVAPRAGIDSWQRRLPPATAVLPAEDWNWPDGSAVRVHPLPGLDRTAVAYEFISARKKVLVSGRVPVVPMERAMHRIFRDLGEPGGNATTLAAALNDLRKVRPDIWLPATIVNDQNANLYDDEWEKLIDRNRELIEALSRSSAGR